MRGGFVSGRRGSNPRPSAWEADALPIELLPQIGLGCSASSAGCQEQRSVVAGLSKDSLFLKERAERIELDGWGEKRRREGRIEQAKQKPVLTFYGSLGKSACVYGLGCFLQKRRIAQAHRFRGAEHQGKPKESMKKSECSTGERSPAFWKL